MVPDAIQELIRRYRDAFISFDVDGVAASYHAPSIMARRDSYVLWATPIEVRANCAALLAVYRDRGAEQAGYQITSFQPQGPHFALTTLDWTFFWRNGGDPLEFHATYNLLEQGGTRRILVATVFD